MKKWVLTSVAALSVLALAGCGASGSKTGEPPREVKVVNANMAFDTKEILLTKGQTVKLVLENKDGMLHDFSIEQMPVDEKKEKSTGDHSHGQGQLTVHVSADAGLTGSVEFIPTKAGTYAYYCTVPGHRDAGMEGKIIVN
jgi:uncharacterized cupredoxin-like copper-binding protein